MSEDINPALTPEQRERERKYPQTILLRPGFKFTESQKAEIKKLLERKYSLPPEPR